MIYPPAPVELRSWHQLKGLEKGEFLLQPKWDGIRGVSIPNEGLFSRRGKPIDRRPWKDIPLPSIPFMWDMEMMRDCFHSHDMMVDGDLPTRLKKMKELGLDPIYEEIDSVEKLNERTSYWMGTGNCDGVILKKKATPYKTNKNAQIQCSDWLKVKYILKR